MSAPTNAPIQSTAGAIPMKNEKGDLTMQKVKVSRYVTGKRPDYAPDSSSEESEDEFVPVKTEQEAPSVVEKEEGAETVYDRRLQRLQGRDIEKDEDDRVARHRREVEEPELIQDGSDSEAEGRKRRGEEEEESSEEEEEELDEEEIERRRILLRQRALQRQEEEEVMDVEDEKMDGDSEEESSEEEDYTDSEEETGPRLKPVFIFKKDRITTLEKEKEEAKKKDLESETKLLAEERRKQALKMIADDNRREMEEEKGTLDACDALDSGDDDEEEYEAWKVRELRRLKRDKEERESAEKEKLEVERLRNMTEEERRAEIKQNGKIVTNKAPKGKYKYLQKYYHRGAFFLSQDDDVYKRDFSAPTLEDHFDKTILPKVMQVKNFGRSGRTKYTHLVDQDTTQFDSPWMTDTAQNLKFQAGKGGGMKQVFERPSNKKRK